MEEERICTHCGEEISEGEGTTVNGDLLCDECVEELCITCEHCSEVIYSDDCITDDHTWLCQDCYEDYYRRCESCGRIIHDTDVNWHYDLPYCDSCYDDIESDEEIEEYSYKPCPIFYGKGERYYGVELEIDHGGKDGDNAYQLKQLANPGNERVYIKSDGSLDEGFEIVSHPMTLDYHSNEMNWREILKRAVSLGYRSHQTSTCGLHIHVNRNAFGENQSEQEEVISRILFFMEMHWNELYTFSRRTKNNINRWAARYGFEKTGKEILDKAKCSSYGRYAALNLCNYNTIEFRMFRGTLKYNTFIATLQLVNEICNVALFMSEEEIAEQSWTNFVRNIQHAELIQYLKERRLYVNEAVAESEEV